MAQPVTAILSRQEELARKARLFTGDANEANLLVGHVIGRALGEFHEGVPEDVPEVRDVAPERIEGVGHGA